MQLAVTSCVGLPLLWAAIPSRLSALISFTDDGDICLQTPNECPCVCKIHDNECNIRESITQIYINIWSKCTFRNKPNCYSWPWQKPKVWSLPRLSMLSHVHQLSVINPQMLISRMTLTKMGRIIYAAFVKAMETASSHFKSSPNIRFDDCYWSLW